MRLLSRWAAAAVLIAWAPFTWSTSRPGSRAAADPGPGDGWKHHGGVLDLQDCSEIPTATTYPRISAGGSPAEEGPLLVSEVGAALSAVAFLLMKFPQSIFLRRSTTAGGPDGRALSSDDELQPRGAPGSVRQPIGSYKQLISSVNRQLELLDLADYDASYLTQKQIRAVAHAKAELESSLSGFNLLEQRVLRTERAAATLARQISAAREDRFLVAHAEPVRKRLSLLLKELASAKEELAITAKRLKKMRWDPRQQALALIVMDDYMARDKWLGPVAAEALSAKEKIFFPERHLPAQLTVDQELGMDRLLSRQVHLASTQRKNIKQKGPSSQRILQTRILIRDCKVLARLLQFVGLRDHAETALEAGTNLKHFLGEVVSSSKYWA